jgi:hypothetical protein
VRVQSSLFSILKVLGTSKIDPDLSKVVVWLRREHDFQKIMFFYQKIEIQKNMIFHHFGTLKNHPKIEKGAGGITHFYETFPTLGATMAPRPLPREPQAPNPRFSLLFHRFGVDFSPMFAPFRIDLSSLLRHLETHHSNVYKKKMIVTSTLIQPRWRLLAGGT